MLKMVFRIYIITCIISVGAKRASFFATVGPNPNRPAQPERFLTVYLGIMFLFDINIPLCKQAPNGIGEMSITLITDPHMNDPS